MATLRRRKSGKILRRFKSGNFNVFKKVSILRSVYIFCALDLYKMLFGYFFLFMFHRGLNPHTQNDLHFFRKIQSHIEKKSK